MGFKYRQCLLLTLLCCCFQLFASTEDLTEQQLVAAFEQEFNQKLSKARVPGGAYAIVKNDRIVKLGSYGVRVVGDKARVNADTVFRLASVSKTFAGLSLVQAQAKHQLQLQQPLTRYVPELVLRTPELSQSLTLEQVVSQSSGFWAHAFEDLIEADKTPAQILPRLKELSLVCPLGRCYSYQNVFFGLLGNALERATGQKYADLLNQRLFKPLGMQTASVGLAPLLASRNKAMPHQRGGKGWRVVKPKANFYRFAAAAGVNASARDLAIYLQAMLGQQPAVLPESLISQLQQPLTRMPGKPRWPVWQQFKKVSAWYGRGWRMVQYDGQSLYYHAGVVDGYRPYISYSPQTGYGLVLLTNAEADVTGPLAGWFWQQLLHPQKHEQHLAQNAEKSSSKAR
ncbi:MAG: beta-lactamase family protein [Gammaproteobacteria bacterium]|nr:beta-lactamase family protein [Gammaproteobacteria bacterium]MBU2426771.1 beta-lactamase family protein [Gammaproteobacteria bacterium]